MDLGLSLTSCQDSDSTRCGQEDHAQPLPRGHPGPGAPRRVSCLLSMGCQDSYFRFQLLCLICALFYGSQDFLWTFTSWRFQTLLWPWWILQHLYGDKAQLVKRALVWSGCSGSQLFLTGHGGPLLETQAHRLQVGFGMWKVRMQAVYPIALETLALQVCKEEEESQNYRQKSQQ